MWAAVPPTTPISAARASGSGAGELPHPGTSSWWAVWNSELSLEVVRGGNERPGADHDVAEKLILPEQLASHPIGKAARPIYLPDLPKSMESTAWSQADHDCNDAVLN